ncbi:uncharacterized protein JCM6883_004711 [Sporobolomyces salmoneus]|uniref:uncharacterized protein n=1 Tax=Sporobolomyces salmoneus TaxID=183962 RepID=UPI00317F4C5A
MSGFSSQSVFSTTSSISSSSSSSTSSSVSRSFSTSKIAWLSSVEVEAAMEKERKSILEDLRNASSTLPGEQGERKDWKRSVGPNTGRKLGKILSKSTSVRSLRISGPLHLKPLDDPSTAYNRTPPVSSPAARTTRSTSFRWFF